MVEVVAGIHTPPLQLTKIDQDIRADEELQDVENLLGMVGHSEEEAYKLTGCDASIRFTVTNGEWKGSFTHEDFEGHRGTIGAGDLQWMTAGRGIVHSEMPAAQGTQKGLQLWINLSPKHKMIEPRYQEILSKDVAEAIKDGIKVRVIAGEALGTKSPIYTRTPTMYLDYTLKPGAHLQQPIPISWNAFIYVLEGEGIFGNAKSSPTAAHHLLLLGTGDGLEVWNKSSKPLRFILVGGEPLGEPLVQFGPFVMNTQEEIDQTIDDFENYVNGFEKARHWRSESNLSLDC
ncbi:pirin-like protein [Quercus lobata]|uniref:pirin-like protein n=1 Tax=Quercus lobata TaxID=97700 RepID=UPI001247CDFB|nr:pirin-like protein [Quercus lobata]